MILCYLYIWDLVVNLARKIDKLEQLVKEKMEMMTNLHNREQSMPRSKGIIKEKILSFNIASLLLLTKCLLFYGAIMRLMGILFSKEEMAQL